MRTLLRPRVVPGFVGLVLVLAAQSAFAKDAMDCGIDHKVCYQSCKDELDWCYRDCDKVFMNCGGKSGGGKAQQTGADPIKPKTGDHMSPVGGAKTVAQ